jgi:Fic family protein
MLDRIARNKQQLDALRPLSKEALAQLDAWYDVELTYTSNAIEGNTLTRQETALVLENGLTVRGKPLKDHQEAVDHLDALRLVRELVQQDRPVGESDIRDIHRLVVGSTFKSDAGCYSQHQRRIAGSMVVFPNPAKVPVLMEEFGRWLSGADTTFGTALQAHLRLVSIHPFSDGNGRTARLLLNLLLMKQGYPPLVIRPEDRLEYIESIEKSQLHGDTSDYESFMLSRLDASLDDYLRFLTPEDT